MRKFHDKILDNKYNVNDIEFEYYGDKIEIDQSFQHDIHDRYDSFEYVKKIDLEQKLYDFTLKINNKLLKARFKNETLHSFIEHFYKFYNECGNDILYNDVDYVTVYCEFFKIDYRVFFNSLLPHTKINILKFLDDKYDVTNNDEFYNIF